MFVTGHLASVLRIGETLAPNALMLAASWAFFLFMLRRIIGLPPSPIV